MKKSSAQSDPTPEIAAISAVHNALKALDPAARGRVLRYAAEMFDITIELPVTRKDGDNDESQNRFPDNAAASAASSENAGSTDLEGINAVALKWIRRSGLSASGLQNIFSLGIDEIDLVAKKVPGTNKKERMRNVILLKGIASYLGTGAPRVTYEQLKEASIHYDAFDSANFASYLKSFAADVSGTKESGFSLSARGITSATELIKAMTATAS